MTKKIIHQDFGGRRKSKSSIRFLKKISFHLYVVWQLREGKHLHLPIPRYVTKNKNIYKTERKTHFESAELFFNFFSFLWQFKNVECDKNWRRITLDKGVQRVEMNTIFLSRNDPNVRISTPVIVCATAQRRFEIFERTKLISATTLSGASAEWQIRVESKTRLFPWVLRGSSVRSRGRGIGRKPAVDARHSVSLIALINKGPRVGRERTASQRDAEERRGGAGRD